MPKTLLLADDSVTIQKVVGISFANEDVVLVTVDNGDDAVAKAREVRPDIVLADVVMPGLNGYEVCEALKADPELQGIPVLLLTGTFEAFDEERANRVGAQGHITKPFEAQALVDEVNTRLAASAAAEPATPTPEPAAALRLELADEADLLEEDASDAPDFLIEDATDPGLDLEMPAAGDATVLMEEDLGLGSDPSQAFGFDAPDEVHDELSAPAHDDPAASPAEPAGDATMLFTNPKDFSSAETAPPMPADAFAQAFDSPAQAEEAEELLLEEPELPSPLGDPLAAMNPTEGDSLSDPAGARDYDVSTSDLLASSEPLRAEPSHSEIDSPEIPEAAPFEASPLPETDARATTDPLSAAPLELVPEPESSAMDPFSSSIEAEPEATVSDEEPASVTELEPEVVFEAPALDVFRPETAAALPVEDGEPMATASPTGALSPLAKQELHDALEKIAWEAFSDVSEKVVRATVERVEKVAWEVIPQMAEALIREEIRKLKGEE